MKTTILAAALILAPPLGLVAETAAPSGTVVSAGDEEEKQVSLNTEIITPPRLPPNG